ncbi:MAG TPA: hypothetical protein VLL75_22950, partial [Vicinamibacteria bacterium]|nr:hypothetical protein [Vicinamibacteria bacterium]
MGGWTRSALLVFLLLAALSASLAARAWLSPPRGTVFVGTFYYVDDFYNYLSYAEQAERGTLVFRNKLADPSLPPSLVNLEWLAVGWLSALLGGRPLLAYRLFGLGALATLVVGADRFLARSGLPADRRLAGLLLVAAGGGLGGLLYLLGRLPGERALDVRTGAFPFVEALANPHFVAGTALLLAALAAFAAGRGALGAALGTALALVRPYDAALLVAIEGVAVFLTAPAREWPRRLLPVLALAPALAYDAWLLLASPGFAAFSSPRYAAAPPSAGELALALGPAALLALAALRVQEGEGAGHRLRLALWAALALLVVVMRPVPFSAQVLVGVGLPLLALAAVGLARLPRGVLEASVPLMATTAAVVTWLCATPGPGSHAPAGRWRVAAALRATCRPGEIVFAPPDVGLYVGGLTACWPYVSHAAAPGHDARAAAVHRFYGEASARSRAALLEETGAALVV